MNSVIDENYIKEFWVKRGTEKKIMKARVKNNWVTFIARNDNE